MSQVIFDIGDGLTLIEHIDSAGVTEPVNGVEEFEAFWGKCLGDVFFTDTIDAVAGKLLPPLIDKEALLIKGLWGRAIFFYVELK